MDASELDSTLRFLLANDSSGVRVIGFGPATGVRLRPESASPEDALLGLRVCDSHDAVAVVATSVVRRRHDRRFERAQLAYALSRGRTSATRLRLDDEDLVGVHPQGWVVDACHRALGLATQPATAEPVDLTLSVWLERVLQHLLAGEPGPPLTWSMAAAMADPRQLSCASIARSPRRLARHIVATSPTWSIQRRRACVGQLGAPVRPQIATWMDDAMFARWSLGLYPDLDDLRADVELLAPSAVGDGVAATLAHVTELVEIRPESAA